ncbi:MAG: transaldolase [Candidatus Neomarinimicrobiota bacterium]|nr:MAG: transaldolase [Candidatus Neomarinimicrobiota bacterium]
MNPLIKLNKFGQSVWLDYIRRDMIHNGELQDLIKNDGLSGITSNPAIFEKAIANSSIYKDPIRKLTDQGLPALKIYDILSIKDVRDAADCFRPVYNKTHGRDGFVSLEVNPHLAHDTEETITEARRLWHELDRPNVMIKVPATIEGLPAITQLISEGINVNVTLIFGLSRYHAVMQSYVEGLKLRAINGKRLNGIASVASFFLSRIDTLVDGLLNDTAQELKGQTAIACAKIAYQKYKSRFGSDSFAVLAEKGAQVQRLLWASTGTKNPKESDIKYVEPLIGIGTVNTLPVATLNAYRDHGEPASRIEDNIPEAENALIKLGELGIDMDLVTRQLEEEGVEKFNLPFDELIKTIGK